jgi:hypothetical protein
MKRVFGFLLLLSTILATACATRPIPVEDDPDYKLPAGAYLVLHKPLTIPADRRSVYIYRGAVTPFSAIDIYYPYCQFRLRKISNQDRVVPPGRFEVVKTIKWDDYTDRRKLVPRFARGRTVDARITGQISIGDGGPPTVAQATIIKLRSDTQPDIDDLVCRQWGDQGTVEHVTVRQMRSALGDIMTLSLGNQ